MIGRPAHVWDAAKYLTVEPQNPLLAPLVRFIFTTRRGALSHLNCTVPKRVTTQSAALALGHSNCRSGGSGCPLLYSIGRALGLTAGSLYPRKYIYIGNMGRTLDLIDRSPNPQNYPETTGWMSASCTTNRGAGWCPLSTPWGPFSWSRGTSRRRHRFSGRLTCVYPSILR